MVFGEHKLCEPYVVLASSENAQTIVWVLMTAQVDYGGTL